ncbi:MAG: MBL fold metallo-hydrolase [Oscillospiraceae bacterium]|jgi:glyoxylase-like metal-dependent hydrolase (beta-lactamase superfamily II)|nr:MBL fold metallo-hydrolase [Oscillospiraceae bacterium]
MGRTDFLCEEIAPGIFKINEFDAVVCYLVIGSQKAAMIDSGTGYGSLLEFVRTKTDLPLELIITHAHTDHIGGMGQFPVANMHRGDHSLAKMTKYLRRVYYKNLKPAVKKRHNLKKTDIEKFPHKTRLQSVEEGDVFDLGGRTLEVFHTPGHSKGHIVLRLKEDKILFIGDSVMDYMMLNTPGCTSLEQWLQSAKKILALAEGYQVFYGHKDGKTTTGRMQEIIAQGEAILQKHPKNALFSKTVRSIDKDKKITILYKSGKVSG